MNNSHQDIDEKEIYEYLVKECSTLVQQVEELLKENQESPKKTKNQSSSTTNEHFYDEKQEIQSIMKSEPIEKLVENDEDNEECEEKVDYKKKKEQLLGQKKYLEDKFLDINIDIQKKAKQLSDFEESIKKTKNEIVNCDKQIKEKTEFIQFLEKQISGMKQTTKK